MIVVFFVFIVSFLFRDLIRVDVLGGGVVLYTVFFEGRWVGWVG